MKRGKKYQEAVKKLDREKTYTVLDAVRLVKDMSYAKFDETVELHVKVALKKSQSVRDTVVLPHQFAAEKRILVFAKGDKAQEALIEDFADKLKGNGILILGQNESLEGAKKWSATNVGSIQIFGKQ